MSDITNGRTATDSPKPANQSILNLGDIEPGFSRSGPILDVEIFKEDYLFGIPLRAALTGQEISNESLKRFIRRGVSDFETSIRIPVSPVRITDRFDFIRSDDIQFGTRQLTRWPILQVEQLAALYPGRSETVRDKEGNITREGEEAIYPTDWIVPEADSGLIRVVPTSGSLVDNPNAQFLYSGGSMAFTLSGTRSWPSLWRITYTAGFDFEKIPDVVNDLIGTLTAIKFLSQMGPAIFPVGSMSVSIDGLGQSVSTPGPQWLSQRMQELIAERERLVPQIRAYYGTDLVMSVF